jgi:hypothetical protein
MNGRVAMTPMVRRNGTSVITTSQARNPPSSTQADATTKPMITVLARGTQKRLGARRPTRTSPQAPIFVGRRVKRTLETSGSTINSVRITRTTAFRTVPCGRTMRRPARRGLWFRLASAIPGPFPELR